MFGIKGDSMTVSVHIDRYILSVLAPTDTDAATGDPGPTQSREVCGPCG
jgi:hypothetical protein